MLYDIGFAIFSIIYLPTLIFKGKLHGDFAERFASYDAEKKKALAASKDAIWIQAVSVGEVALCKSLIPSLKEKFPNSAIVLSTITKTGNDLAKKLFSNDAIIIYFPLDFSFTVKKAVALIRPKIYIMVETEIWPNMLKETSVRSIPSILINGRISDRSINKYKLVKPFLKKTLERISLFCMQSKTDAERMISLGADPAKVKVTGNMKFDVDAPSDQRQAQQIRESLRLKPDDDLFVAGSIHPGEELLIIRSFRELNKEFPRLRLLIAPRHVENLVYCETIAKEYGFNPLRVSKLNKSESHSVSSDIIILDTIGQLKEIYSIAALVFIGGSFVKHGGQNPIEPAMFAKPIFFGPHMFNFKAVAAAFLAADGAVQITEGDDMLSRVRMLLEDEKYRARLGENAKRVVEENRGATERNLKAIAGII